jgi:D-amino-acid dehydrogenase
VLNAGLRSAALSRGLEVIEGTATIAPRNDSRLDGVITDDGPVSAGAVVVAGGAWSEELGTALGVSLPVFPLKGQIVHLTLPEVDSRSWPIVQPVLSFYLVPWPEGRVACGGTLEAEAGFDHRVTADGLLQLLRECLRTAPGLASATVLEVRVGSRPATPDGRPVVGGLPGWANVLAATGHGTEGLLLGPYSAAVVADLVLGSRNDMGSPEETALVLDRCSPDRFIG